MITFGEVVAVQLVLGFHVYSKRPRSCVSIGVLVSVSNSSSLSSCFC